MDPSAGLDLTADLDLGAGLRLRTLTVRDVDLVVEATRAETAAALWGPRPAGPYSPQDARTALEAWKPDAGLQTSYGILEYGREAHDGPERDGLEHGHLEHDGLEHSHLEHDGLEYSHLEQGIPQPARLLGALGLMPDGPRSAELAYWVRPENRRRGLALRSIHALTQWAHDGANLSRIWLEVNPDNTPSLRLAERAGYHFEQRIADHCRTWTALDPEHDTWHDCLIWSHTVT